MKKTHARTVRVALATLALAALACASPITSDAYPDEVLTADKLRAEAMVQANPIELEKLLHERLTYTHSNGLVDTKNSLVAALISNSLDYRAIESKSRSVRVSGKTAVVTGLVNMEVRADEQDQRLQSVYTAVYWLADERWQLVAYQSTSTGRR